MVDFSTLQKKLLVFSQIFYHWQFFSSHWQVSSLSTDIYGRSKLVTLLRTMPCIISYSGVSTSGGTVNQHTVSCCFRKKLIHQLLSHSTSDTYTLSSSISSFNTVTPLNATFVHFFPFICCCIWLEPRKLSVYCIFKACSIKVDPLSYFTLSLSSIEKMKVFIYEPSLSDGFSHPSLSGGGGGGWRIVSALFP